jgi:diguanylate cyclase (GGDEF)-like protein
LTTTIALHPNVERLITTITTLTGHEVALEPSASSISDDAHRWDVISTAGERYGVLSVRAPELTDPHRALYADLSRMIAHEAELRREKHALEDRFRRLDRHVSELATHQHSLSSAAYRDSLTGLYRPWYLHEQIRLELARATRHKRALSLVILECDNGGDDHLTRAFAEGLTSTCRNSDIVARLDATEFCAVLPDTNEEGAARLIERLRLRIHDLVFITGMTTFTGGGDGQTTSEQLLEIAKRRLHRARNSLRGSATAEL